MSLLGKVLQKVTEDQAEAILVAPIFTTQPWFPRLLQMICSQSYILPRMENLLTSPRKKKPSSSVHENGGFQDIREHLIRSGLPEESAKIIMASWRRSTQDQYGSHIKKWLRFCGQEQINSIKPSMNQVILFLTKLHTEKYSYRTISAAKSAISTYISLFHDMDIGSDRK
ncbi:uncharacterized protein LOC128555517 [Mercenaria mercenaria]|uniref:uncharacterized protein LOC128555517 n=1 Tax=Mercenaria mercenaria TaxID=6596 RepID=UPI00234F0928|nr:uncharacterized protein LOC128555517 [Mercenaria mercenaria]